MVRYTIELRAEIVCISYLRFHIGTIDYRLPFKPVDTVPASEIQASFGRYARIPYVMRDVEVSKPEDYGQLHGNIGEGRSDSRFQPTTSTVTRAEDDVNAQRRIHLELLLRNSEWYNDLETQSKFVVNQQLAMLAAELNDYHENTAADKSVAQVSMLKSLYLMDILKNLCVYISNAGTMEYLPEMFRAPNFASQPESAFHVYNPLQQRYPFDGSPSALNPFAMQPQSTFAHGDHANQFGRMSNASGTRGRMRGRMRGTGRGGRGRAARTHARWSPDEPSRFNDSYDSDRKLEKY